MIIEKIITLASKAVQLRFLAMERSLRDSGCDLPLWVIPYNDERFDLPSNAKWWEIPEVLNWLDENKCHKAYRKYQCLLTSNYQFVDSDVIFLRNPQEVLKDQYGFITSCGHWRSPNQTFTLDSIKMIRETKTSLWEKYIFNTGQFACDTQLYDFATLKSTCENPKFAPTCLYLKHHEQPGINMLVNATTIKIHNITLPPEEMESTFAADYYCAYPDLHLINFEELWNRDLSKKPYLIHWAGCDMDNDQKINSLFTNYLTPKEKEEWKFFLNIQRYRREKASKGLRPFFRRVKRALKIILNNSV